MNRIPGPKFDIATEKDEKEEKKSIITPIQELIQIEIEGIPSHFCKSNTSVLKCIYFLILMYRCNIKR